MEVYRTIAIKLQECEATGDVHEQNISEFLDIIYKRDLYIAQRIKEDLKIGEVDILFLGNSHNQDDNLANSLSEDGIKVTVIETSPH